MVDVFVSYSQQDAQRVEPLVGLLESRGCTVWWDRLIEPGRDLEQAVEQALEEASSVVIALTRHASASDRVRADIGAAQDRRKVIPVLLDDVPVPLQLRSSQVADLRAWPEGGAAEAAQFVNVVLGRTQLPERLFVGRESALRTLQEAFASAADGLGGLALLSGEPGIGKTRCAEAFAQRVEDQGALVLWGRCYEHPGAPPYWPWVQILRGYADANSDDELRLLLDRGAGDIAALVPEIGARLGLRPGAAIEASQADQRFQVFDAISRVLANASASVPQVLVIDDLHWADASSLSLLEYLAKDSRRHRVLILCTYRDVEVTRKSPLLATLGELAHAGRIERVRLSGLSVDETRELTVCIAGTALPPAVVDAIFQQTDGNPLFVKEVAKVIAEEQRVAGRGLIAIDVPDGVREAIGRRLNRLTPACNELLGMASVLGRAFDLRVVTRAMGTPFDRGLADLEDAVLAGILQPDPGGSSQIRSDPDGSDPRGSDHRRADGSGASTFRFTHSLIRETLFDELPTHERLRLHERVARALIDLHGSDLDPVLSQLVHHFCEASALGDYETAVAFALQAAVRDERVSAFEESLRHYDTAVRVLIANGQAEDSRLVGVYARMGGIAIAAGLVDQAVDALVAGIVLARRQADPEQFSSIATLLVRATSYGAQTHAVPLLEEALQMLPPGPSSRRAVALGHLAFALRARGDLAAVQKTAEQAIVMARPLDDPPALVMTLHMSILGLRGWAPTLSRRLEYGVEAHGAMAPTEGADDRWTDICQHRIYNLIEAGDLRSVARMQETYRQMAAQFRLGRHGYNVSLLDNLLALMRGDWARAEPAIEQALELGQTLSGGHSRALDADGIYGVQMFVLNRDLGRLRGMAPVVERMIEDRQSRLWAPGLLLMCCEVGLLDHARRVLENLVAEDLANLPRDDLWAVCLAFCAEACAVLQDADRAALLYDLLIPYAEQTIHHPTAACFGAASAYLGLLAGTVGRREEARKHFRHALNMNRDMAAWPALARTQLWLGRMLLASETMADHDAGRQVLVDAEQLAARLQMAGLSAEVGVLLNDSPDTLPDGLTAREADVLKLLAMGRSNKDIAKVLAISLSTVATHVRSILNKSGCANRTEAAAYAIRQELT